MVWLLVAALVLSGCSAPTFETVGNVIHVSATQAPMREVTVNLPQDAAVLTASGVDSIYTCNDYTMSLQVFPAGDLAATVTSLCGYSPQQLTMLESICGDHTRRDWVWTAAGENGDVLCRAAVLDDGNYHYSLCVMADAKIAGSLTEDWNALFASFCLG